MPQGLNLLKTQQINLRPPLNPSSQTLLQNEFSQKKLFLRLSLNLINLAEFAL